MPIIDHRPKLVLRIEQRRPMFDVQHRTGPGTRVAGVTRQICLASWQPARRAGEESRKTWPGPTLAQQKELDQEKNDSRLTK